MPMRNRRPSAVRIAKLLAFGIAALWGGAFVYLRNPVFAGGARLDSGIRPDVETMRADVVALASTHPARSVDTPEGLRAAETYIARRLRAIGYDVELRDAGPMAAGSHNIVVRYGPSEARERIVVGAHYDVYGVGAPGADDNASGVAVLLEIARLLRTQTPMLPVAIELVAYTLEEPPAFATSYMGSFIHARSLADDRVTVRLMISLEMLGYYSDDPFSQAYSIPLLYALYPWTGDFVAVIGRPSDRAEVRAMKKAMMANGSVPVVSINAPSFVPGIDFSDHRSYWAHGWPAVMVTDTAFLRNRAYHQTSDTPERLDYVRMGQVALGVYAAVVAVGE